MSADPASLTDPELHVYLDLIEVAGLLRLAIDRQLRESSGLSYLQFQLLTRLQDSAGGSSRMTELADSVVHSRSGLSYQAGLLEAAGLVTRSRSSEDDRGVLVTITQAGRSLLSQTLPGHVAITRRLLFEPLSADDVARLAGLLGRVRQHVAGMPRRLRRSAVGTTGGPPTGT